MRSVATAKFISSIAAIVWLICCVLPTTFAKSSDVPRLVPVSDEDLKMLKALDLAYQKQKVEMAIVKIAKIPLLDQERKSSGHMWISDGRLRMELEGTERNLVIANQKTLWVVTYPPVEFKDAPTQVIKANISTKKGRSQSLIGLLGRGGFLKFFDATGVQKESSGEKLFYLSPKKEQVDVKRLQMKVSADGARILQLNYWDDRDNETKFEFSDFNFQPKIEDKLFKFVPPERSEVMNI